MKVGMLLCACGEWNNVDEECLGFEELECAACECTLSVPENLSDFEAYNLEVGNRLNALQYTGRIRVMVVQETGEESCEAIVDVQLAEIVVAGIRTLHPEYRSVFTEPELTTAAMLNPRNSWF